TQEIDEPGSWVSSRVPNDPYYASRGSWGQPYDDLWNLKKIQAERAWDVTQGDGVVVAVIDTGLDYDHPDISANVWTNPHDPPGDIPDACNRVADPSITLSDDDCNGYPDDFLGWDFTTCARVNQETRTCAIPKAPDNDPADGNGHGTHVAGIIAAVGDNGIGIIGVAPQAKVMPLKVLNDEGAGLISDLAQAIDYAARHGAKVINMSSSCPPENPCPSNPVAEDAVRGAYGHGAVVVVSAGNDANDVAFISSPQNMTHPKPIVVASTDHLDQRSSFSNYGVHIDVSAPGGDNTVPIENILSLKSAVTRPETDGNGQFVVGERYLRLAGTSMAAPHAAGVAALVLAAHPLFTPDEVRQALRASADDVSRPGFDLSTGTGRINAGNAIKVQSALRVKIKSPPFGAALHSQAGSITIHGTAAGPTFQRYQLFYGRQNASIEWLPIGQPVSTQVEDGVLGTWAIGELSTGTYLVKVVATTFRDPRFPEGLQFQDLTRVAIEPPSRQITTDSRNQITPAISGDRIVWQDARRGNSLIPRFEGRWDVYLYDLTTNEEQRITGEVGNHYQPSIWGDRIVWEDDRNGDCNPFMPGADCDIFLYDLATHQEHQIAASPTFQSHPVIVNDWIVWEDNPNNRASIPLQSERINLHLCEYDPDAGCRGPAQQLTGERGWQFGAAVSGNRVVWQDDRNTTGDDANGTRLVFKKDWDLYLCEYDPVSGRCPERQITRDPSLQMNAAIDGDLIVWNDSRNGHWDIYLYDVAINREQRITADPHDQLDPAISGNRIVWMDDRNGNFDIYTCLYDRTTGICSEQQLTSHLSSQKFPAISSNRVVWQDDRNGNWDIYMSELPDGRPMTPTLVLTAQPARVSEGQQSVLSWASAHADQCQASGGWSGVKAVRGTEAVSPTTTTRYSLTCTGSAGSASQAATVSVFTVSASPLTVRPGETLTIDWTAPPGRPSTDLLGVNVAGSPPASPLLSQSTGGAPTGRLSYTLPPGTQ
ncbi:MAG: S8 family serine peptidase, partial [Candidatus Omnitrophica bacterium]|nr:S8 family serine peptidase [Candidatus Omnitrophota bacterium]